MNQGYPPTRSESSISFERYPVEVRDNRPVSPPENPSADPRPRSSRRVRFEAGQSGQEVRRRPVPLPSSTHQDTYSHHTSSTQAERESIGLSLDPSQRHRTEATSDSDVVTDAATTAYSNSQYERITEYYYPDTDQPDMHRSQQPLRYQSRASSPVTTHMSHSTDGNHVPPPRSHRHRHKQRDSRRYPSRSELTSSSRAEERAAYITRNSISNYSTRDGRDTGRRHGSRNVEDDERSYTQDLIEPGYSQSSVKGKESVRSDASTITIKQAKEPFINVGIGRLKFNVDYKRSKHSQSEVSTSVNTNRSTLLSSLKSRFTPDPLTRDIHARKFELLQIICPEEIRDERLKDWSIYSKAWEDIGYPKTRNEWIEAQIAVVTQEFDRLYKFDKRHCRCRSAR